MQKHTKVYLNYFGFADEYIPCEICKAPAVDIHHIKGRGKGKDVISNLMALCRDCHIKAHSSISKADIQKIHDDYLNNNPY